MFRLASLFLALTLSLIGQAAVAQSQSSSPEAMAAALLNSGVEARRQGHDAAALALFEQAALLMPSSELTAQIGLAEQALGRWVDAATHLAAALEGSDPFVQRHRATLVASLEEVRNHLGSLEVLVNVDGAELSVRGARATTLPSPPIVLPIGRVEIEITKPGYRSVHREVIVRARLLTRESVELFAESTRTDPRVTTRPTLPHNEPPPGGARAQSERLGALFWTGIALSAAGGITAGSLALLGNGEVTSYQEKCTATPLSADAATSCESRRKSVQSTLDGYLIGIGVSVGVLAVGAVLATFDAATPGVDDEPDTGPTIAVTTDSILIGYSGRY